MECLDLDRLLPAYADGEFATSESTETELHLAECQRCRDQVERQIAFRTFLQAHANTDPARAPDSLRLRIQRDIAKERAAENLRRFASFSAMAAGLAVVASAGYMAAGWLGGPHLQPIDVIADAVDRHARGLPVEVTPAAGDVESWFRGKVDFNVRTPRFSSPSAPQLMGARLANVREKQAAYFMYGDEAHKRMSLLVFPSGSVRLPEGQRRSVGGQDIVMANERGYNVALWEKRGIVYSLVSDLDESDILQLVSQVEER